MKRSLSAGWIACFVLLMPLATGCNVSGNGLSNQRDASDGSKQQTSDARPDVTTNDGPSDAGPSSSETGPADATSLGIDLASTPDVATPSPDLALQDSQPAEHAPGASEVEQGPDVPVVSDGSLPSQADVPASGSVDTSLLDTARADAQSPDLSTADLAPDLPEFPDAPPVLDLASPDLPPPDVAPSPTAHWVVDNTTNIGGNEPTVLGSPVVTAMDAGTAVCFDGIEDGLIVPDDPIQGLRQFTIETLVYPQLDATLQPTIVQVWDPNNTTRRVVIQMRSDATGDWHLVVVFAWNAATTTIENTSDTHSSDQWYWLAVTYDGQTARVYVDGVLEDSSSVTFGPMAAGSISLATRQVGRFYFPGCMRDVEFFDSALPASQLSKP